MRNLLLALSVVAALLLSAIPSLSHAGLNVWTSGGPDGQGDVSALAIAPTNPSIIYAGGFGGVFRSKDGGDTWSPASNGLIPNPGIYDEGGAVYTLAVDPTDPSTVYAGTIYEGAFKTTNGGASWSAINAGLAGQLVSGLAIDPATPSTVYAVTLDAGVFKSIDGGAIWSAANNGLSLSNGFLAIVIDPANPSTLYVAADNGVYKSTDGAASWGPITSVPGFPWSLAIDPQTPSTLYVGTQVNGVFKSTDGGASFTDINTGLTSMSVSRVAVDPTTPSRIYVGMYDGVDKLFRSSNGGASWTPVGIDTGNSAVSALAVHPQDGTAYAGTWTRGFFRSATGSTWHASNTGLSNSWASVVAVDPATPSRVYAGTLGGGLFKSTNGAASWTAASNGLVYDEVDAIAIDPATPTTLYAAPSLFKSANAAASWSSAYNGLGSSAGVLSIAIDPATPSTLYAGTFNGGVFKSTNAAGSWNLASNGLTTSAMITALAIDPATPTTLYAGWRENFPFAGGVFKSIDGAANWSPADSLPSNAEVFALAIDPATPSTLYAATLFGVYKSVDGAASWTQVSSGFTYALAIDPTTPSTVYAGTGTGGVFKSTDSGASWNAFNAGLSTLFVVGLAVDPTNSATLYAATRGGGVFSITQSDTVLDHFTCYKSGGTSGSVKFPGIASLPLTDEFGPASVAVKKTPFLCAPTDKNGENPGAETHTEHLEGYGIKNPAVPALPTHIMVLDQFNPRGLFVDAKKASHLLVPAVKDLLTPPSLPGAFIVDHFECYKVKGTIGKAEFTPVLGLPIEDQFGTMTVNVKKPKYLCNPVDKNGEDPSAPTHPGHLMCYQVKQVDLVKFVKKVGVFVNNQFGPETLDVKKPALLCVPALKNP